MVSGEEWESDTIVMSKRNRLRLLVRNFHENGLKFLLENPANVHDLLRLLDVKLTPRIDFAQMRVVPGRFVARDYRHLESDIVLQAPVRPPEGAKYRRITIYVLVEHQSEPDRFMPLRVLEYVVMIYKRQTREWMKQQGSLDNFQLQPVLPIVLYTGMRTWDSLGSICDLVELSDELANRIPDLQPLFLNVGRTSEKVLQQGGAFGLLLQLLRQRRSQLSVFEETLREVVQALESLGDSDRDRWLELLSYIAAMIYNDREIAEREPLQEMVTESVQNDAYRQEVIEMGKTIAEDLIEKGYHKGRREGRQEEGAITRRLLLMQLLSNRFGKVPAATVKRIEATENRRQLDQWFKLALSSKSLAEVFVEGK